MRMKRVGLLIASGFVGLLAASSAIAVPISAINYDGSLASGRADFTGTIGNLFTVGAQSLTVTDLGAQDFGPTGANTDGFFAPPISVGIWNAAGTSLLASTTVASADPLTGSYRYDAITPIVLIAGTQYLIGARVGGGIEWFGDAGAATPYTGNGIITLDASRVVAGGFAAPTGAGGLSAGRWAPANFLATSVPEPFTFSMLLFGCIGLWLVGRKQTR